jgi:hypothetical protein
VYHVELRQFPHNVCRFNLTDADLRPLVEPWVREMAVECGERRWSPHTATLTILEGPELEVGRLSLGRGWRAAQREGQDVTQRVLAAARQALALAATHAQPAQPSQQGAPAAAAAQPAPPAAGGEPSADPLTLGVQIAALLGPEPLRLLEAWRAAAASTPDLSPSQALALAELNMSATDANRA